MKGYYTFPKASRFEFHYQMQLGVISKAPVEVVGGMGFSSLLVSSHRLSGMV